MHGKKHQLNKFEDTTNSSLKQNILSTDPGLTTKLLTIDMTKVKPRNYVTGKWVITINTDKQSIFLRAKARWVLRGFQDKQKEYLQTGSLLSRDPDFG